MSLTITQAMVDQFSANVILLSQQKDSRLQKACQMADVVGKNFYAERIGSAEMYEQTTRHEDLHRVELPHTRRMGTVHDMKWMELIDSADTEKTLIDINGKYVQAAVAAANRAKDSWIIKALGGVAHAGASGGTSVNNYDSGECRVIKGDGTVATAGSDTSDTTATTLTYAKVVTAKSLLDAAEVDPDRPRFIVCNSYAMSGLLSDTTLGAEEARLMRDIVRGEMRQLLGFYFIQMEYRSTGTGLLYNATETDCLECYAFAQGAVTLGVGSDVRTKVERIPQKDADQVLATLDVGAERNEGPAVVEIMLKAAA